MEIYCTSWTLICYYDNIANQNTPTYHDSVLDYTLAKY